MRPKDCLRAVPSVNGGAMLIAPISGGNVILLGASCSTNGVVGNCADALVIVPDAGAKDVVAIQYTVFTGSSKNGHRADYYFFIGVDGGNNKPVNLEDHWIPSADRLAVISEGCVQAEIEGVRYTGAKYPDYSYAKYAKSGHHVDPNLLCRYLVGKATAEEVRAAAKEFKADEPMLAQKEQKELQAEVERLNIAFVVERNARQNAEQRVRNLERGCEHASAKIAELQESNGDLHEIAWRLYNAAQSQWFKSSALREAMRAAERAGLNSV